MQTVEALCLRETEKRMKMGELSCRSRTDFLLCLSSLRAERIVVSSIDFVTFCLQKYARITSREIVPAGRIFSHFLPSQRGPHHHRPLLSRAFLATGKVLLFVIGRVRFLVKPRCFANRLLA